MRKKYETDFTDEQWDVIAPLFVHMRKRKIDSQSVKTTSDVEQKGFDIGKKQK